jgi:hypothetical protein
MKPRWLLPSALAAMIIAPVAASAKVSVGWISQQVNSGHATIGASVETSSRVPSHAPAHLVASGFRPVGQSGSVPVTPTLSSQSPLLRDPTPAGPNSMWYTTLAGQRCIYLPNSETPCFNLVNPQPAASGPGQGNPAAMAAAAAALLPLLPGRIETAPSAHANGLTGAPSWFWLEPSPGAKTASVSLGGEQVTVTATPSVSWSFGDGAQPKQGPGVPYRPGSPPTGAVVHVYQTRCLPGDQGRDPDVLPSCGAGGYPVRASVDWAIAYKGTGPVTANGALPSRTTATALTYPVSEARGFLTKTGSGA